jgi:hypothetical protein
MKRFFSLALLVFALAPRMALCFDDAEQDQQISILQSSHSLREKDAACARLKWIGTARWVPAISGMELATKRMRFGRETIQQEQTERTEEKQREKKSPFSLLAPVQNSTPFWSVVERLI